MILIVLVITDQFLIIMMRFMNEDTHFPRCKAGRVTPDKFEKGNTWQAGRRITIIKSLQLSGEIFFFNNALAQKKKWGWYHLTFVAKFVYPNFIGQVWSLPCPVCHLIKLLVRVVFLRLYKWLSWWSKIPVSCKLAGSVLTLKLLLMLVLMMKFG